MITIFISPNRHARKTTTPVRFSHILPLRFTQVTAFTKKIITMDV